MRWFAGLLLVAVAMLGCAARDWNRVRAEDTPSAYHRFLREHSGSAHAGEARERLAFAQLRSKPTPEGYESFLAEFPESPLLSELRPIVEKGFFERARAAGTADAYRGFLARFPDGSLAARAAGNAEYLEQRGFGGRPTALGDFAVRHAASDFAAEASRSAAAVAAREQSAFGRAGLLIEISASTPGPDRLRRAFTERAVRRFEAAGLGLVPLRRADDPEGASLPVRLTIHHAEEEVRPQVTAGEVTRPGILATTTISLARAGEAEPIWSDRFDFRTSAVGQRADTSILFGPGTRGYWERFFVPVASWSTQIAVRPPLALDKSAVAVEATGSRAIVLFQDGGFRIYDIGDPEKPLPLGEYRRPRDLARWSDLRVLDGRVILFGEDGIEIVRLAAGGPERVRAFARDVVGSVVGVEAVADHFVAASNRGLFDIEGDAAPQNLVEREIHGLARLGERIVFSDGVSVYISTLPLLRAQRVEAELRLGQGVGPGRIRVVGSSAVVLAQRGVMRIDLSKPTAPRLASRVDTAEVGRIADATLVAGQLFLLGDRGLQLADMAGERVVESADLAALSRLGSAGRHLVAVGETTLQVVDTTPFVMRPPLAAPRP
jgi:hypothetical protein